MFSSNPFSRAQTLAIVVGDPGIASTACSSVADMERANMFCRLSSHAKNPQCPAKRGVGTTIPFALVKAPKKGMVTAFEDRTAEGRQWGGGAPSSSGRGFALGWGSFLKAWQET